MEDQNIQPVKPENQDAPSPTKPLQPTIQSIPTPAVADAQPVVSSIATPTSVPTGLFVGGATQTPVSADPLLAEQRKPKKTKLTYFAIIGLVVLAILGTVLYFTVFNNSSKPIAGNTSTSKSTQATVTNTQISAKTIKSTDGKVSVKIPPTWIELSDKPGSTSGTEITDTTKSGDLIYQCDTPSVYTIPSLAQTCNYAASFELPSKTEDFLGLSIWYNNLTPAQTIQSEVLSSKAPVPVIVDQNSGTTTNGYSEQYVKYYTKNTWNQNTYINYIIANKGYVAVFSWNESDQPWNTSGQNPYQIFDYSNLAPEVTNVVNSLVLNF
ncbi:MAG TPA: hypothetical protein VMQ52_00560 [Candidatus Saccharimonadales bacterium]|nr:hypothetical protein [Candidatus Saccharimonadales bacterium]